MIYHRSITNQWWAGKETRLQFNRFAIVTSFSERKVCSFFFTDESFASAILSRLGRWEKRRREMSDKKKNTWEIKPKSHPNQITTAWKVCLFVCEPQKENSIMNLFSWCFPNIFSSALPFLASLQYTAYGCLFAEAKRWWPHKRFMQMYIIHL